MEAIGAMLGYRVPHGEHSVDTTEGRNSLLLYCVWHTEALCCTRSANGDAVVRSTTKNKGFTAIYTSGRAKGIIYRQKL